MSTDDKDTPEAHAPALEEIRRAIAGDSEGDGSPEESRHHDVVMSHRAISEVASMLAELSADLPDPDRNLSAAISALGSALHRLARVADTLKPEDQ